MLFNELSNDMLDPTYMPEDKQWISSMFGSGEMKWGTSGRFENRQKGLDAGDAAGNAVAQVFPIAGAFKAIGEGAGNAIGQKDAYGVSESNAQAGAAAIFSPLEETSGIFTQREGAGRKLLRLLPPVSAMVTNKENRDERDQLKRGFIESLHADQLSFKKGGVIGEPPINVDSVLGANKNLDWVKRLYMKDTPSIPTPDNPNSTSTHLMGHNGQGYVFPHVVNINGKLKYLKSDDEAEQYARSTNSGIQMTPEQAAWFAANGYKTGTNVFGQNAGGYQWDKEMSLPTSPIGFKHGGEMKSSSLSGEDIAMIDKWTGKKVGEVSYGERIMDKAANERMKELAKSKDYWKLGKYVAGEMETQPGGEDMYAKGGQITAAKAKMILKDGTIRGKKITDKQKKFFGFIAGGGSPDEYKNGGTIREVMAAEEDETDYAEGGVIGEKFKTRYPNREGYRQAKKEVRSVVSQQDQQLIGMKNALIASGVDPREAEEQVFHYSRSVQSVPHGWKQYLKAGFGMRGGKVPAMTSEDQNWLKQFLTETRRPDEFIPAGIPAQYADGGVVNPDDDDEGQSFFEDAGGWQQIPNIAQFVTGLIGANDKLPTFNKPADWNQYLLEARRRATYGASNTVVGAAERGLKQGLTSGLDAAREISGGNSSFAVGDAARVAGGYMDNVLKLAEMKEKMKTDAVNRYGNVLLQDVSMDKDAFSLKYNEGLRKQSAAATLAQTGLQSAIDQVDYNKQFGKGSIYNEYLQSMIDMNKKFSGMDTMGWLKHFGPGSNPVRTATRQPPGPPVTPADPWGIEGDPFEGVNANAPFNPWLNYQ